MMEATPTGSIITVVLLFAIPLLVAIVGFFLVLPYIRAKRERYPGGGTPDHRSDGDPGHGTGQDPRDGP